MLIKVIYFTVNGSCTDMIVDDINIIRELIDVRENYKSINVRTMYDVDFMTESICIN